MPLLKRKTELLVPQGGLQISALSQISVQSIHFGPVRMPISLYHTALISAIVCNKSPVNKSLALSSTRRRQNTDFSLPVPASYCSCSKIQKSGSLRHSSAS